MDEGTILVYSCPSIFSLTSPPSQTKCTVYKDSVCLRGRGGGELCCRPYSAGILHSVSDQIQNIPNCFTTPKKMSSEDAIKGLVSLKFLRPCIEASQQHCQTASPDLRRPRPPHPHPHHHPHPQKKGRVSSGSPFSAPLETISALLERRW